MKTERGARRPFLIQKKGDNGMYTLKINKVLGSKKVFDSWENCYFYERLYAVDVLDDEKDKIMTFSMYIRTSPVRYDGVIWTLSDWQTEQPKTFMAFKTDNRGWAMMSIIEQEDGSILLQDHCGVRYELDSSFDTIINEI